MLDTPLEETKGLVQTDNVLEVKLITTLSSDLTDTRHTEWIVWEETFFTQTNVTDKYTGTEQISCQLSYQTCIAAGLGSTKGSATTAMIITRTDAVAFE